MSKNLIKKIDIKFVVFFCSASDGPQLDGRHLLESILSIITSDSWSSCSIVIKELSHLLINNVLCFHKYLNELREQEWIGKIN